MTKWDRQLVGELRAIGISDAQPVETGFRGSNVGGHDGSRYVTVSTSEQEINYDAEVLRKTSVRGTEVEQLRFGSSQSDALLFKCGELEYLLRVFSPEASTVDVQASRDVARRIIQSLECS